MEERKLEWESDDAKKQRAIRDANRVMDARAGSFVRSWEEDPSVHHDSSSAPPAEAAPPLTAAEQFPAIRKYAGTPTPQERRAARHRAQQIRRRQRPRRKCGQTHRITAEQFRRQIGTMRRIRVYLLLTAAVLIIAGVVFALLMQREDPAPAQSITAGLYYG